MKSFKIANGDLVLGPGGFATISGAAKVKQDLAIAVREPLGSDRFHPNWGTTLHQFVGQYGDEMTRGLISSEVTRLVRNYVAVHGEQVRQDIVAGRKARYGTGELIEDIQRIDVRQDMDRLYLRVHLSTASGETVTLTSTTGV